MAPLSHILTLALACIPAAQAISGRLGESKSIGYYRRQIAERQSQTLRKRDVDPELLYPEYNFSTPVDHFHNESQYAPHSNDFFPLRYWFDASHYRPGGPVIVLQSGEVDASERLPYLQKGILAQLAEATHGIGVVLEHRYYGTSFPTPDLSTANLRFLTTQQALADEAYFAQHIQFEGLEHHGDLSSNTTAYFSYGGSYAGAFSAFLRIQYPDIFWGAIGSSGVTKAIYDYPQYYYPIAEYAPQDCVTVQKTLTHLVDNLLTGSNNTTIATLKAAFSLPNITYNDDFAAAIADVVSDWQSLNWDPAIDDPEFYYYCDNITSSRPLYSPSAQLKQDVATLTTAAGYNADNETLQTELLNYIGYTNLTVATPCAAANETQDQCYGTHNPAFYQQDTLDQYVWRSWSYQICTEYGFFQTGEAPAGQLPLLSKTISLDYLTIVCRDAFNRTAPPDVAAANKYGGYDIAYPRLAFIDGEWDPWRPATPHAFGYGAQPRVSTSSQPFILMSDAVHHWDENGLFPNQTTTTLPPHPIAHAQKRELHFVREWLREWQAHHLGAGAGW